MCIPALADSMAIHKAHRLCTGDGNETPEADFQYLAGPHWYSHWSVTRRLWKAEWRSNGGIVGIYLSQLNLAEALRASQSSEVDLKLNPELEFSLQISLKKLLRGVDNPNRVKVNRQTILWICFTPEKHKRVYNSHSEILHKLSRLHECYGKFDAKYYIITSFNLLVIDAGNLVNWFQ